MSEYLVILHDAEPPTDTGRQQLQQELVAQLGIAEDAVRQMFDSLPVILKENVSRQHAEEFLRVLESMGANVEILASSGDTAAYAALEEGETPLLQVTEESSFSLALEGAADEVVTAQESVEDLEKILNSMLGETPDATNGSPDPDSTQDAAGNSDFFFEQEELEPVAPSQPAATEPAATEPGATEPAAKPSAPSSELSELAFTLDAEEFAAPTPAPVEAPEDSGPSFDDLTRILEEELGFAGFQDATPEQPKAAAANAVEDDLAEDSAANMFALSDLDDHGAADLESLLADAANSLEAAHDEPQPSADELFAFDAEDIPAPAQAKAPAVAVEAPAVESEDDGPGIDFSFTLDAAPEEVVESGESALEAALLNQFASTETEDPFGGLDLSNVEPASNASSQTKRVSTIDDRKAQAKERKKQLLKEAEEAEISSAFAAKPASDEELAPVTEPSLEATAGSAAQPRNRNEKFLRLGVVLVFAVLLGVAGKLLFFPSKPVGLNLTEEQLLLMADKGAAKSEAQKRAELIAAEPSIQRWAGTEKLEDGSQVTIEMLTNGNKILGFEFFYEGAQPAEITPEELVEGIDRPWVRKVDAKALSLAEVVERTTSKSPKTKKILVAESPARAYVSDLKGSTRFAGSVRVELAIEGTNKLVGSWQVTTSITPAEAASKDFHIKRLGPSSFELALNGKAKLTPLVPTSKGAESEKKEAKKQE